MIRITHLLLTASLILFSSCCNCGNTPVWGKLAAEWIPYEMDQELIFNNQDGDVIALQVSLLEENQEGKNDPSGLAGSITRGAVLVNCDDCYDYYEKSIEVLIEPMNGFTFQNLVITSHPSEDFIIKIANKNSFGFNSIDLETRSFLNELEFLGATPIGRFSYNEVIRLTPPSNCDSCDNYEITEILYDREFGIVKIIMLNGEEFTLNRGR